MEQFKRKKHWETIYETKQPNEVSWYQPIPELSLNLITKLNCPTNAKIIDVGGGDSFLVDNLLDLGYTDITVLDISEKALNKAKQRLGVRTDLVKWIVADIATFIPTEKYAIWHDRAAFHFLTQQKEISHYVSTVNECINPNGFLLLGTFSENGPKQCSGIKITQYNEQALSSLFTVGFNKVDCITIDHQTPFDTVQNFIFGTFQKL